jgi:hypothetical protein
MDFEARKKDKLRYRWAAPWRGQQRAGRCRRLDPASEQLLLQLPL